MCQPRGFYLSRNGPLDKINNKARTALLFLEEEMFDRLIKLINQENFTKINQTTVAIIGLGGVGGYAIEHLVRSGIGSLILIDYDTIDETNLNRQIVATQNNLGNAKTIEWKKRIESINKNCQIKIINQKLTAENFETILTDKYDYLIDACDTLEVKKKVLKYCTTNKIKFISSMGTGNKLDPTKLAIKQLSQTSYDPIAKLLRKYIKDEKITSKIFVVSSTEPPQKHSNPIASISFVPAYAGLLCAYYVIHDLINHSK